MGLKNGKPCKTCGRFDYNSRGDCNHCAKVSKRAWYTRNRESVLENHRNADEEAYVSKLEYTRRWRGENRDKRTAYQQKRRARQRGAGGSFTSSEWQNLQAHHNHQCLKCGRGDRQLTADHIISLKNGGTSNIDNIQPLCQHCNSSKGTKNTDYRNGGFVRWIQRKLF